jgi:hypothetical protein
MQGDASRRRAQREVLGRQIIGVRNDRGGAARSGVFRDVGGDWDANQRITEPQTGGNRRIAGPQTGGNRRGSAPQTGANRRIAAPRAARGCGTLVGGLAGIASDVSMVAKPCAAILDSPYPDTILDGTPHPHRARWQLASPPRGLVAARIPFTARIGVGAVQNRRRYHRFISTVCGDAGRPAHQRPKTPHCARRRHDRFAPR